MRDLLARTDSLEIAEWMAFETIEPFGYDSENHRIGVLTSLIANCHRNEKKQPKPFIPQFFFPHSDDVNPSEKAEQEQKAGLAHKIVTIFKGLKAAEEARKNAERNQKRGS